MGDGGFDVLYLQGVWGVSEIEGEVDWGYGWSWDDCKLPFAIITPCCVYAFEFSYEIYDET